MNIQYVLHPVPINVPDELRRVEVADGHQQIIRLKLPEQVTRSATHQLNCLKMRHSCDAQQSLMLLMTYGFVIQSQHTDGSWQCQLLFTVHYTF